MTVGAISELLKYHYGPRPEFTGTYAQLCALLEKSRRLGREYQPSTADADRLGCAWEVKDPMRELFYRRLPSLFSGKPYERPPMRLWDVETTQQHRGARR